MGFGNLPVGLGGAVTLVTIPQLMSAQGSPESAIAMVTTIALVAGFANFLVAPILDWRFSRRSYAIGFAILTGVLGTASLLSTREIGVLATLMFLLSFASYLNQAAVGGWFSSLTSSDDKSRLGAWLQAANVAGFGTGAAVGILLIRNLPPPLGAMTVGLLMLLPIPIYLATPATPASAKLGHESFRAFLRDVMAVLRQPVVRWLLFFLAMPAASFALSNTLSGLGKDFGASEAFVGAVAGVGVAVAGVIGALVVPPIIRRLSAERAYLAIGAIGAAFTLMLILAPRNSASFALAMIGQNGIQAAAFAAVNVLVLRSIKDDNPLAATQFALLVATSSVPLTYMQAIDGNAYDLGGLTGSYLTDAAISLAACAVLGLVLIRRRRRRDLKGRSPAQSAAKQ
jgi:PAT family beta-lactamase induction signal transducer AmpG